MERISASLIFCILPAFALAAEPSKSFEVASIKPAATAAGGESHFHEGTSGPRLDAARWACDNCSLAQLLAEAYDLKRFQITGPKWLDSERFNIVARVPEGATKDDLHLMVRSLLTERFALKAHLEKKDMQVYDLVAGKTAPKLKEALPGTPPAANPAEHQFGHDNAGRTTTMTFHGITRHQAAAEDMGQFADFLASQLDRPVTDSTGLKGKYDFLLTFSSAKQGDGGGPMAGMTHGAGEAGGRGGHPEGAETDPMSQPPLQKAVQDQLGLRLEAKKGSASLLIVDQLEKTPSEN